MKNIISKMFVLGAAVSLMASCNLDRFPLTEVSEDTFYASETEVELGLLGAYEGIRDAVDSRWEWTELRADNAMGLNGGYRNSSSDTNIEYVATQGHKYDEIQDDLEDHFNNFYIVINRCNIVLANLDVCDTESIRTQIEAEARTLRAMMYFDLVRFFGETWYVTDNISGQEALTMEKSSVATIMANIISELEAAVPNLPTIDEQSSSEIGRFTQEAGLTLLAKVYLTDKNYAKVISSLSSVVSYGTTNLVAYDQIWSIGNEMNQEVLFALRNKTGNIGLGGELANTYSSTNSTYHSIPGGGSGRCAPVDDILTLFGEEWDWVDGYATVNGVNSLNRSTTDARALVCIEYDNLSKWFNNCKYYDNTFTSEDDSEVDEPLIRYADALLMYAEAQNQVSGPAAAVDYVNATRTRAGLPNLVASEYTTATMHDEILLERRLEFAFECERFFDLQREGIDAMVAAVNKRNTNGFVCGAISYDYLMPADITTSTSMYLPIPFGVSSLY